MKKVLLYNPKLKEHGTRSPPLPLLAISGLLLKEGYKIKIFDAFTDKNAQEKVLKNLNNAICVGFSVMTGSSITDSLKLAKKIKKKDPNTPIVWGGWHPSILPTQTIKHPHIDIIVRGQGEATFLELIQQLEKDEPLRKVQGITYKHNGKIITNPNRPRVPLDNIPPMPYHLIDVENYLNNNIGTRTLAYVSSQGCPFKCSFCADALIYKGQRMELSTERVIKDLKHLIETYKVNAFMFEDTNFFVNKGKVQKICSTIIENEWNIKWGADARADQFLSLDKKTLELIRDSGCSSLIVGAESGSQKILDFLNKGIKVEDIINFGKRCKKYGIKVTYDFMIGLPNETVKDLRKTMELITKLYKIEKNNKLSMLFYVPYPGTVLYDIVIKEYNFKPPKSLTEWSKYVCSTVDTIWANKKYKRKVRNFQFYLQFAFLNQQLKKRLGRFTPMILPLHWASWLRLSFDFFTFPIEKVIYETIKRIFKEEEGKK